MASSLFSGGWVGVEVVASIGVEPMEVAEVYEKAVDWAVPVGITFTGFVLAVYLISFALSKFF